MLLYADIYYYVYMSYNFQFLVVVDGPFHLVVYAVVKVGSGANDDDEQPRGYNLATNLIILYQSGMG